MTHAGEDLSKTLAMLASSIGSAPDLEYAFLGGSAAAGFGNPTSDLDLFVGGSSETIAFVRERVPASIGLNRIDIETVDEVGLEQACEDLTGLAARIPDVSTAELYAVERQVKMVGAAVYAVALPPPCPQATTVLARASNTRSAYRRVLNARSNVWINNTAEDLRGLNLALEDLPTRRRAHNLLELALDMWLTALGQDYPDEKYKWITHRIRGLVLDTKDQQAIFDAYHPEQSPPTPPEESLRVAGLAQVLRARAILAEQFSFSFDGVPLAFSSSGSSIQCLPWLMVGLSHNEVRATTHHGAWSLPIWAIVVLALASGRSRTELVEMTAEVLDRTGLFSIVRSEIDDVVEKLLHVEILI